MAPGPKSVGHEDSCSGWVPSNRANAQRIDIGSPLHYSKGVRAETSVLWQSVQSGRGPGSGSTFRTIKPWTTTMRCHQCYLFF